MKTLSVICVFFISLFLVSFSYATVGLTGATNGQIFYLPQGQTSISIPFTMVVTGYSSFQDLGWDYVVDGSHAYQPPLNVAYPVHQNNSFTASNLGFGSHVIYAALYRFNWYTNLWDGIEVTPMCTITVAPAPTHGTTRSSASQSGPGTTSDTQTSSYISPGSNVAWVLDVSGYNGSTTKWVQVFAGVGSYATIFKDITRNDGYYHVSQNGSIPAFAGGTIPVSTMGAVQMNGNGNACGVATITW